MPYKLLLADDSVTIQRVIELTFADEDVQVTPVSDGDQAIVRIDAEPPDIVLADVGMPGRDGYEVAAHVKHSPRLAHIPVLLLTGAFEPVDEVRARSAGCDGVLAKPFEPQIVIARVRELLSRSKTPVPAPRVVDPPVVSRAEPAPIPQAAERGQRHVNMEVLDQYFDRLSAAFAELSSKQRNRSAEDMPSAHADALDRFERAVETQAPDLALSYKSPPIAGSATAQTPSAPTPPVTPPAAFVPAQSPAFQAQADADAALTTAKHVAGAGAGWPAEPAPSAIAIEDLVEQVTRRAMERLSDQVVREAVSDLVRDRTAEVVRQTVPDLVRESTSEVVRQMVPNLVSNCTSELVHQVGPHLVGDRISDLVREMAPDLLRERVSEIVRDLAPELVRQAVADAVRATARELFIPIAERMVREEINRINASIG